MSLDAYREAWKEGDAGGEVLDGRSLPEEELLARVRKRSEAFDRKIRRRDLRELVAGAFVVLAFGYGAITAGSWLTRAGALVVIAAALFIAWTLRRARAGEETVKAGRPVTESLRAQLEKVDVQIRLLENVLWWYVAPLAVGALLFAAGLGAGLWPTLLCAAVILTLSAYIWRLNLRAVERDLRPRRRRIERLLRKLEGPGY